jgi:phosphohistidine swiveling domain-containing protein
MYIESFQHKLAVSMYGEKAANLARMTQLGFPIPPGFAISVQAFEKNRGEGCGLSFLREELKEALGNINAPHYMVRSSAIGEDGEGHSFAGQLESFISSNQLDEICGFIEKCWRSYERENVAAYQQSSQQKLGGMGVVIQQLVDPDFAGVIFTRSHLHADAMLIEYVTGHGEQLVSGAVNPKLFHYDYKSEHIEGDDLHGFSDGIRCAMDIEKHYGKPMDIEWAMKDGVFWVVQARPITTKWKEPTVFWSNTNVNENYPDPLSPLLYSIARKSYYHYFKNLARLFQLSESDIIRLETSFSNVIGSWGAKMYYNMSSIHEIMSASPFSTMLVKSFDNFVGYNEGQKSVNTSKKRGAKVQFVRSFLRLDRTLLAHVETFENRADRYAEHVNSSIVMDHHRHNFHQFMEIRLHSWYHASMADFFAMAYHGLLGKFCQRYFKEEATGIQNKLIQAIPNLISSKPVIEMHDILVELQKDEVMYSAFHAMEAGEFYAFLQNHETHDVKGRIERYLLNWGFRCSGELMLRAENYTENPSSFIALLQQYAKMGSGDPERLILKKYQEAIATQKMFRRKIWTENTWNLPKSLIDLFLLKILVKKASKGISARERVRLKQASLYFHFKKTLNQISKHWVEKGIILEQEDIYFLTTEEIAELLDGSSLLKQSVKPIISQRKLDFQREASLAYPDDFSSSRGEDVRSESLAVSSLNIDKDAKVLHGLCACGGTLQGTVKVLHSVMEADKLNPGDILVTRQTDPGWVVVFPMIHGLIVERGGMLSHGAIVSREFGIPAVVGVPGITEILKDGDHITLFADQGKIVIHD